MKRDIGMRTYLKSIKDVELPKLFSGMTKNFVDFVVEAHSWYKSPNVVYEESCFHAFNFFIAPSPQTEIICGKQIIHTEFGNLNYGVPGAHVFDVSHKIPREIFHAGLAIVPLDYLSSGSRKIMVIKTAEMLDAIKYYRKKHPSIK